VLNGSARVSESARNRTLEAIAALGYRPSFAARTLAKRRTDTLGVVFPRIAGGFYTELLRGIDQSAAQQDYHLLTAFAHGRSDEEELVAGMLSESRVDALILLNLDLPDSFVRDLDRGDTPVVLVDRPVRGDGMTSVSIENRQGADVAMSHLLGHGYEDVVVLAGPRDSYDSHERLEGCRAAAKRAGQPIAEQDIWYGGFTVESGQALMRGRMETHGTSPRAIFALNDAMALGVVRVLREHGLRVPEDVAIVGFDDWEAAAFVELTTVQVPLLEMGRVAGRAAIERVRGDTSAHQYVMPTHLVIRSSCGCAK